jgi:hypothetical protein
MGLRATAWRARKRIGERVDLGPFLYRRGVFDVYDGLAANDAEAVIGALRASFPGARTYVDVGAGTGRYVRAAQDLGLAASGLERSGVARRLARERTAIELAPFSVSRSSPGPKVDLAYSFEVAEHVPERLAPRLVAFLCACAPTVVLTAATPGQGGVGHVNEQPREYWVDLFARHGFHEDRESCDLFVQALPVEGLTGHWTATNVFVFRSNGTR